jgi:hypothetical protein
MDTVKHLPTRGINMSLLFDTLQYTKQAVAAGFTQQQAEFQAEKMAELVGDTLVTKSYFKTELTLMEKGLKHEMSLMENRLISSIHKMMLSSLLGIPAIFAIGGALYHAIWK